MKRGTWKQSNPADQIVQLVSGIAGYGGNLAAGLYDDKQKRRQVGNNIKDWSEQLIELVKLLPPTRWP